MAVNGTYVLQNDSIDESPGLEVHLTAETKAEKREDQQRMKFRKVSENESKTFKRESTEVGTPLPRLNILYPGEFSIYLTALLWASAMSIT